MKRKREKLLMIFFLRKELNKLKKLKENKERKKEEKRKKNYKIIKKQETTINI